jgi:CBS domain-containing protein
MGGAPVVDHERVEGVVTISDLEAPRPYARETRPFHRPHSGGSEWQVRDVMTESAVTASPEEPLVEAVVRMARARWTAPGRGSGWQADRDRGAR